MSNAKSVWPITAALAATLVLLARPCVAGTNHYVDANSPTPTPPYTNWLTAAHRIQDAVDAAAAGSTVWVTNGVYDSGGVAGYPAGSSLTNRVAIHTPLTVRALSTNPADTVIMGRGPIGPAAVRGVYMVEGAVLANFTITAGATLSEGDYAKEKSGGGLWAEGLGAVIYSCLFEANSADSYGGGVYGGTLSHSILQGNGCKDGSGGAAKGSALRNCTVAGNWSGGSGGGAYDCVLTNCLLVGNASDGGGGAYSSTLIDCTLTGNAAWDEDGGGSYSCTLINCIVYYNSGENHKDSTFRHSCTTPHAPGPGNVTDPPLFVNAGAGYGLDHVQGDYRLLADSPCVDAGTNEAWMVSAFDLDGLPRIVGPTVDMGAYELHAGGPTGTLTVAVSADYTNAATGFPVTFTAVVGNDALGSLWNWGDGAYTLNQDVTQHAFAAPGVYGVVLTAWNAVTAASTSLTIRVVEPPVHYVSSFGSHVPPFTSWSTAATDIQAAVDAATVPGAHVLVTNGTYGTGGRAVVGALANRVAIDKPLHVRSVNGPSETTIMGLGPLDEGGMRCAYVGPRAKLSGFCLRNGRTLQGGGGIEFAVDLRGGGVICEPGGSVSNCWIRNNWASSIGGGAYRGSFFECLFAGNTCGLEGGGAHSAVLLNSILTSNSAAYGAGAYGCSLVGCSLTGNAAGFGGGADQSHLSSCTLVGNSAFAWFAVPPDGAGGGVSLSTLTNSVVYYNAARKGNGNYNASSLATSCTTPLPSGQGHIADPPLFVNPGSDYGLDHQAGDYRLLAESPCINTGANEAWMEEASDLEGVPRIIGPAVDMGAYEYPLTPSGIPGVWLRDHGLPTDGSEDLVDTDGDGMNNRGEYEADTIPTDVESVLRFLAIGEQWGGTRLDWTGGRDAWQFLEIREGLTIPNETWTAIYAVPPPTPLTNAVIDLGATNRVLFYRIRAER